ncbi:MAG TPA: 3-oxoacyl-ACP reductase FabG [Mycobacteriales bacterium]|nr:3-oxoacyl-ACP reductase FabG [Mycobacteriales bacterium]
MRTPTDSPGPVATPPERMSGRSVLVTGGSRGIGLAVARTFAAAGHRVAVTHHASDPPDDLFAVKCDVGDPAQLSEAVASVADRHGPVEILVAAAGIARDGLAMRMPDRDWYDVLDTNLTGSWGAARAVLPAMVRARWGRLVFLASVTGLSGSAGQTNYAASKAGLVGLARSLAREYAGRGITANVVAPGLVDTDMTATLTDRQRRDILTSTPLGRAVTTDEVAAAVTFLTGESAAAITGAVLPVDCGLGMGH